MSTVRQKIKNIPFLGRYLVKLRHSVRPPLVFRDSVQYWEDRYSSGGTSGSGSYGRLAIFKAKFLNEFVAEHNIKSVVEYGCGDGAQLELAMYDEYTGFDVSRTAVAMCSKKFAREPKYEFFHTSEISSKEGSFDLSLSLDVIYLLIEDEAFYGYMSRLFGSASKYVIVYAYNFNTNYEAKHEKGREFLMWSEENALDWKLIDCIKNAFPYDKELPDSTSQSDFFVFEKTSA